MPTKIIKMSAAMMQSYEAVKSIADKIGIEVKLTTVYTEANAPQLALLYGIAINLISKATSTEIEIIEE